MTFRVQPWSSSPCLETEFVDLGGKDLWSGTFGRRNADRSPWKDYFEEVLAKLKGPKPAGIIVGSSSYHQTMSAQCKIFPEHCAVLREPKLLLADRVVLVLAAAKH